MPISPIQPIFPSSIPSIDATQKTGKAQGVDTQSFTDVLNSLNQSQQTSDDLTAMLAAGEDVDLHQVMISAEETDVNFRVTMAIRDRLIDAYREVMRMSV